MIDGSEVRILLASMQATLVDGEFVFATVSPDRRRAMVGLVPVCEFREQEGISLIVSRSQADAHGLAFTYPCRQITLAVNSSLEAVGFLAAIAARLAAAGISVNAQSAYFHDHLFVPTGSADEALRVLQALAAEASTT